MSIYYTGSEVFTVNTTTENSQGISSVTGLVDGGFVVTWSSLDGSDKGVYGQRYNADGSPVGSEFQINTYINSDQNLPVVTGLADGGFVVTWVNVLQDGSSYGVFGQRYNADGSPAGSEFQINT